MKISIVTGYCGQEELTIKFLYNLQSCMSPDYNWEVILLNNSDNKIFIEHPVVTTRVDHDKFMSFSEGFNKGLSLATGDYIVLMGNDVFPQDDGWITSMLSALLHSKASIVSPLYKKDYRSYYLGDRYLEEGNLYEVVTDKWKLITANCWMQPKEDLLLFDEAFYGGFGCEDIDLVMRLLASGKKVIRALNVVLDHRHEQGETASNTSLKKGSNWHLIQERWGY